MGGGQVQWDRLLEEDEGEDCDACQGLDGEESVGVSNMHGICGCSSHPYSDPPQRPSLNLQVLGNFVLGSPR